MAKQKPPKNNAAERRKLMTENYTELTRVAKSVVRRLGQAGASAADREDLYQQAWLDIALATRSYDREAKAESGKPRFPKYACAAAHISAYRESLRVRSPAPSRNIEAMQQSINKSKSLDDQAARAFSSSLCFPGNSRGARSDRNVIKELIRTTEVEYMRTDLSKKAQASIWPLLAQVAKESTLENLEAEDLYNLLSGESGIAETSRQRGWSLSRVRHAMRRAKRVIAKCDSAKKIWEQME